MSMRYKYLQIFHKKAPSQKKKTTGPFSSNSMKRFSSKSKGITPAKDKMCWRYRDNPWRDSDGMET
jgi:hypothetical protein